MIQKFNSGQRNISYICSQCQCIHNRKSHRKREEKTSTIKTTICALSFKHNITILWMYCEAQNISFFSLSICRSCCFFFHPILLFFFTFSSSILAFNHETLYPSTPLCESPLKIVSNSFTPLFVHSSFFLRWYDVRYLFIRNIQYDASVSDFVFFHTCIQVYTHIICIAWHLRAYGHFQSDFMLRISIISHEPVYCTAATFTCHSFQLYASTFPCCKKNYCYLNFIRSISNEPKRVHSMLRVC